MKNDVKRMLFPALTLALVPLFAFQTAAKAEDTALTTEKCKPEEIRFEIYFSKVEKTGIIQSFDVSDGGRAATLIGTDINVYDPYGVYDYTIYTTITHSQSIPQWDKETLLIYLRSSGIPEPSYYIIKVTGYDAYEVYQYPANDNASKFWSELAQNRNELVTDKGRYYVQSGNLRYTDHETGDDYAITENTSFQPWWLLSIPILTAIIWFGGVRKKVKEWEEAQNHPSQNTSI